MGQKSVFDFHFETSSITPNHYCHPFLQSRPSKATYDFSLSVIGSSVFKRNSKGPSLKNNFDKERQMRSQVIEQGQRCKTSPVIVKCEKEPIALSTNLPKHHLTNWKWSVKSCRRNKNQQKSVFWCVLTSLYESVYPSIDSCQSVHPSGMLNFWMRKNEFFQLW